MAQIAGQKRHCELFRRPAAKQRANIFRPPPEWKPSDESSRQLECIS
jgi:hypothetical protein